MTSFWEKPTKFLRATASQWLADLDLHVPPVAEFARRRDRTGLPEVDPGPAAFVDAAIDWLCRAQDSSATHDGGVAHDYNLVTESWGSSYPETTGYIVPTVLEVAARRKDPALEQRARRMLDWLVSIQFPDGGIQCGRVDDKPRVPVTFNTGQVLLGLAAGTKHFGARFLEPTVRAATWLRDSLDPDGCWRKHPTRFAVAGDKSYETHVSWAMFEAERIAPGHGFGDAGLRQVRWALTKQRPNGWFEDCCLTTPAAPLTHTIGYAVRGVIEAHLWQPAPEFLEAATRTADSLLGALGSDGRLPGRLDAQWRPAVDWVCLTGTAQIAHCWLLLHRLTRNPEYLAAGRLANRFVRRTVHFEGPPELRGAVQGAFPVDGRYCRYLLPNWPPKFAIDSNLCEMDLGE